MAVVDAFSTARTEANHAATRSCNMFTAVFDNNGTTPRTPHTPHTTHHTPTKPAIRIGWHSPHSPHSPHTTYHTPTGGLAHMWVECSMLQTLSLTQKSHSEDVFEVFHHLIQGTY